MGPLEQIFGAPRSLPLNSFNSILATYYFLYIELLRMLNSVTNYLKRHYFVGSLALVNFKEQALKEPAVTVPAPAYLVELKLFINKTKTITT